MINIRSALMNENYEWMTESASRSLLERQSEYMKQGVRWEHDGVVEIYDGKSWSMELGIENVDRREIGV